MDSLYQTIQSNQILSTDQMDYYLKESQSNAIIAYFMGMYYEKQQDHKNTELLYKRSIQICPNFAEPRFQLFEQSHQINYLLPIFNQPTFSPYGNKWNLLHQLRITSSLIQHYIKENFTEKVLFYCKYVDDWCKKLSELTQPEEIYRLKEIGKNCYITLGNIASNKACMEEACQYYIKGLNLGDDPRLIQLNDTLFSGYMVSKDYCIEAPKYILDDSNHLPKKIRIGYIGPDFNKNAAGLFLSPFLRDYDVNQFEIYVYYTNMNADIYTQQFKKYSVHWKDCGWMSDKEICTSIKKDQIYILVDLISCGTGGRIRVLREKPCPIIISAIGYPGRSYLQGVDYFLTDPYCQPSDPCSIGERGLYLPCFFSCYSLFENETLPAIKWQPSNDSLIRVGVFNKINKLSKQILRIWKYMFEKNINWHLYIKADSIDAFSQFPKDRIHIMEFKDRLMDYFDLFNQIDFTLDTFPYSGTTTTCSSLLMGCPVLCTWSNKNSHVQNVTGSLLKWCNMNDWIYPSIEDYEQFIFQPYTFESRLEIRNQFLKVMDSKKWMHHWETSLKNILKSKNLSIK